MNSKIFSIGDSRPQVNQSYLPSSAIPGQVWYNGSDLMVYDGSGWICIEREITVFLDPEVDEALDWLSSVTRALKQAGHARDAAKRVSTGNTSADSLISDAIGELDTAIGQLEVAIRLTGNLE